MSQVLDPTQIGYSSWRPGQEDVIRRALALEPGRALVVEAPTGVGKSAVPAMLSRLGYTVTVIVGTKDLQEQYARSFFWASVVWGKNGYTCMLDKPFVRDFRSRWGRLPTVEECYALESGLACADCPYTLACAQAAGNSLRVLNYHYAFYASWWRKKTDYVVLDEVHRLEPTLRDLVRVRLSGKRRVNWGLPAFPKDVAEVPAYLEDCADRVERGLSRCEPEEAARRLRWVRQVRAVVQGMQEGMDNWFPILAPEALEIRPIDVSRFTGLYTLRGMARVVAMSATPPCEGILRPLLGMPLEWVSIPHIIPAERRPVYYVKNAPRMNMRAIERDGAMERQRWFIADIVRRYPQDTVLILTSTWEHAVRLGVLLGQLVSRPVVVPDRSQSRSAQTRALLDAPRGSVVISPSHWEGLDLHDDLCRAVVVAKVPFPDLDDPVVRVLLSRPGGRTWYDGQACLKAVQGIGRAVRHPEDWADGWIVDGCWPRVKRYAPSWFKVEEVQL